MPFGIKLRRTGRYILSHKNSFLVRVQLLDNTVMECTLTVENTGNDCLNAVANKLDLKEVQYFGLRYLNKQLISRWVELDKPLKKQVDKNAHDPTLHFAVMYYVANLELLQQEITRYLFYLQLKNNVIDGYLPATSNQAIELASYMLQAEFGDHNPDVHTVQYFRDFILLPEVVAPTDEVLDSLTSKTLTLHQRHRSLTAPDAEYNYVLKVLHLDGYGEEAYPAKDLQNADCEIGCSFVGIVIRQIIAALSSTNVQELQPSEEQAYGDVVWHEWNNVDHVACGKSMLVLNLRKDDACHQFHMEDADTAKYVCRMFEQRRKFYSVNRSHNLPVVIMLVEIIGFAVFQWKVLIENGEASIQRRPTLRRTQGVTLSDDEIDGSGPADADIIPQQQAGYLSSQENLHAAYSRQPETQYYSSQTSLDHAYVSQTSLNHVPAMPQEYGYANGNVPGGSMYSSTSINSLVQSQPKLHRQSPSLSNMSLRSLDRHLANGGVPVYRCTPDYEQAVRQRRRYSSYLENHAAAQQHATNNPTTAIPDASRKPRPHSMIYSPQELLQQAIHGPHYAQYPPQNPPLRYHSRTPQRVDSLSHLQASQSQLHHQLETSRESLPPMQLIQQHPVVATRYVPQDVRQFGLNNIPLLGSTPGNIILAASTPELANPMQQKVKGYSASEMQLLRYYTKPPPPYPPNNSTSTPDLSVHRHSAVSASSPDLHKAHGTVVGQQQSHILSRGVLANMDYAAAPSRSGHQQGGRSDNYLSSERLTVIRGVCTSVEGLQQNLVDTNLYTNPGQRQHIQTPELVQAYLQHLATEQPESTQFRTRHHGQHPLARHDRPVSYPPRLNQSHPLLVMDELGETSSARDFVPVISQNVINVQSHQSSSTSTVESLDGSQQYLHQGSQINLHRSQLAPADHPVIIEQPLPQRADTTTVTSDSTANLQFHSMQFQKGDRYVNEVERYEYDDVAPYVSPEMGTDPDSYRNTPQHSQMPSNATMLIHSSASEEENVSSDDDEYKANSQHVDYTQMSLTTIDHWHREESTKMYVPPKPKVDNQLHDQEEKLPPPYPRSFQRNDQNSDEDHEVLDIPKILLVGTEDHDPPCSYRKPTEMESYDEADMTTVSVFPHPNPSIPHPAPLSEENPSLPCHGEIYDAADCANKILPDIDRFITELEREAKEIHADEIDNAPDAMYVDSSSKDLRRARRSTRKSQSLKEKAVDLGMQNLPSPSAGMPDERVYQLEKKLEDGQVLTEYEKIPRKRTIGANAFGDSHGTRDRVRSVVPYADNRIRVQASSANPEGYMNASLVQINVAEEEWSYIMCQNPLDDYLHEFWEMIWEDRVCIIVMISKEVEDGRVRCGRYWPENAGDLDAMLFGNYRVSCEVIKDMSEISHTRTQSEPVDNNLVTSHIVLQRAGTTECRKVWHLQYIGWPDRGAPQRAESFLVLMEELGSVRRLATENLSNGESIPPVVVHCASGAGRSGVLVLCDLMRHSLERNESIAVPEMLEMLRNQRMDSVQTVSQYNFVYQVLILFLNNSRLI